MTASENLRYDLDKRRKQATQKPTFDPRWKGSKNPQQVDLKYYIKKLFNEILN